MNPFKICNVFASLSKITSKCEEKVNILIPKVFLRLIIHSRSFSVEKLELHYSGSHRLKRISRQVLVCLLFNVGKIFWPVADDYKFYLFISQVHNKPGILSFVLRKFGGSLFEILGVCGQIVGASGDWAPMEQQPWPQHPPLGPDLGKAKRAMPAEEKVVPPQEVQVKFPVKMDWVISFLKAA